MLWLVEILAEGPIFCRTVFLADCCTKLRLRVKKFLALVHCKKEDKEAMNIILCVFTIYQITYFYYVPLNTLVKCDDPLL